MRGIIGWLSATLASGAGWWVGAFFGVATAIILSVVTGSIGLYYGYRWFDRNLG